MVVKMFAECNQRSDCPDWITPLLSCLLDECCSIYTAPQQRWILSSVYTALDQSKWVYGICLSTSGVQFHRFHCHPVTGKWRNAMPHIPQTSAYVLHAGLRQALMLCPLARIPHHELEKCLACIQPDWKQHYVRQPLRAPQTLHIAHLKPLQKVLHHYHELMNEWALKPECFQVLNPALLSVFTRAEGNSYALQTIPLLAEKLQRIHLQATPAPELWRALWRSFFRYAFQRLVWPSEWLPDFRKADTTYTDLGMGRRYTLYAFESHGYHWEWEIGQQKRWVWVNQVTTLDQGISPGGWPLVSLPLGLATLFIPELPSDHPVLFPWELFAPIRAYRSAV